MEKNKENTGLYAVGAVSAVIIMLGVLANSIYYRVGGYYVGAGLAVLLFFAQCFLYANSSQIAKVRAKDMLIASVVITAAYLLFFILADMAGLAVYKNAAVSGQNSRSLEGLGIAVVVYEALCLTWGIFQGVRLVRNLFGKELNSYEKYLGTDAARRKEAEALPCEFARKDTDKLVSMAERAVLEANLTAVNAPIFPHETNTADTSVEQSAFIGEKPSISAKAELPEDEGAHGSSGEGFVPFSDAPTLRPSPEITTVLTQEPIAEPIISQTIAEKPDVLPADEQAKDITAEEVVFSEPLVSTEPFISEAASQEEPGEDIEQYSEFAKDVRQEYVMHRTTIKAEDEDDGLYTDFSYGANDESVPHDENDS